MKERTKNWVAAATAAVADSKAVVEEEEEEEEEEDDDDDDDDDKKALAAAIAAAAAGSAAPTAPPVLLCSIPDTSSLATSCGGTRNSYPATVLCVPTRHARIRFSGRVSQFVTFNPILRAASASDTNEVQPLDEFAGRPSM